jgi:hypothetical protein
VSKSHSCVGKSQFSYVKIILCVCKSHFACQSHTLRVEITFRVWKSYSACINYTRVCRSHTQNPKIACWNHILCVEITLMCVEISLLCVEIALCLWESHYFGLKSHYVCENRTLREYITLVHVVLTLRIQIMRVEITFCVWKLHSCVWKSHFFVNLKRW